jgi:murein L,D-transpeptidase YafK
MTPKRTFPSWHFIAVLILMALSLLFLWKSRGAREYIATRLRGDKTVGDILREKERAVRERLTPYLAKAGMTYPLTRITFLVFKQEKLLELWGEKEGAWHFVRNYPVLAASGKAGPKLKEGDRQVPEGIYDIVALNPNGDFYLTMLIDYPNAFDRKNAIADHRTDLGGDICIHGKAASIGCLAMGDVAAEELFVLTARAGMEKVKVIIAPNDLRNSEPVEAGQMHIPWVPKLYRNIKDALRSYPKPPPP